MIGESPGHRPFLVELAIQASIVSRQMWGGVQSWGGAEHMH